MKEHPILFKADMVVAIMTCSQCGTITLEIECPKCGSKKRLKTQTRRICRESFIYSLTDDRIYGILTDVNVIKKGFSHAESRTETDTCFAESGLLSWLRWTNLLSDEIQRLWEKGIRGLVSIKRAQAKGKGVHDNLPVPRQQEGYKVYPSSCMYGLSRDAGEKIYAGEAFGWEPVKQQAGKFEMGNPNRKLAGQKGSRERLRGREAPNGKTDRRGVSTLTVGNQKWVVQPATGSKGIANVSGWHLAYSEYQIESLLWVREPFRIEGDDTVKKLLWGRYTRDDSCLFNEVTQREWDRFMNWKKPYVGKSSLYMFKSLARLWLKVKSVRGERVQDISHADIEAEGVTFDLIRSLLKPTKTKQGHWITGRDCDSSEDYCYDCAKKVVDELNAKEGDRDNVVDGGWENHDSDYQARCEKCDCLLNYWPTTHLFETEVDGFESRSEIMPLSNEDRYSLETLLGAAPDQDEALQNRVLKLCWRYLWDSINAEPKPCYRKEEITHYVSYPWQDIRETREYRGKPWYVYGNPLQWVVEFERTEKEQ